MASASHDSPGTQRKKYLDTSVPLSLASMHGDWRLARVLIEQNPELLTEPISITQSTSMHLSIAFNHKQFVEKLIAEMKTPSDIESLTRKDLWGTTPFCVAAITGNIDILRMLVQAARSGLEVQGYRNHCPLELAAKCGHLQAASYLYRETDFSKLTPTDVGNIFLSLIESEMFGLALKIFEKNSEVATFVDSRNRSALYIIATMPHDIGKQKQLRWYERASSKAKVKAQGRQLLEEVWSTVRDLPKNQFWRHLSTPCHFIYEAAKRGHLEVLRTVYSTYPDFIYVKNSKRQTVYHIAAAWRQDHIFQTIFQLGAMKSEIASLIDLEGNTMLHVVASKALGERLSSVSGPALQMQHELLWFQAVEEVCPKAYRELRNKQELTPHQVFVRDHEILKEQGEKWLKETSTSCMVVSALITTVIFATVFTVPGGTDEDTGLPKLGHRSSFAVFVLSAGIGFSASLASLLIFLSIITSRYTEKDFIANLPLKLMCGMISLYLSIISMLLSFVSALFLIRGRSPLWRIGFIASLGFLTALAYITVHGKLCFFTFRSAWKSKHLFSRKGSTNLFQ